MKYLMGLALIFGSTSAFADFPMIGWQCQVVNHEEAHSPFEFSALQRRYPTELGRFNASSVSFAAVDVYACQYYGSAACQPDDSRLKATAIGYSISTENGIQTAVPTFSRKDPCAP